MLKASELKDEDKLACRNSGRGNCGCAIRARKLVVSRNEHSPTSSECQLIRQIETERTLEEGSSSHTSG
jgi:hypothetical protein